MLTLSSRFCLGILLIVSLTPALFAQRDSKVPDPDPELERKSFILPEGFEVNLFAADPLLAKPIQMNFDARGRLWIACSEVYPQIKPGEKANDKVVILEDTKGVGKADKVTVFADGLLIPTGLEPGDGGVYVANSTELLHLSDPDSTGKATKKRVVLSGFGTEDTHHILHTLRWGPDGMLYMNQSIYIHSHIETPYGVRHLNAGGIWQFRPETMQLEVFARGWVNPWGHCFDRWGQSFVTDGAGGEGINYVVPGGYYTTAVGAARTIPGLNPGSPKDCGLEILSGRHLPDDWQGNLITNDFRGHRVCRYVLKEDGSAYLSQEKGELIKTKHEAFRPIDVKMGPDGAIYIADWYNPIIQHGEVDFRDPRRDLTHGRIWRITAKDRPLVKRPQLVDAGIDALLDQLKAPEDWTRHFAKRVLKERDEAKVTPALKQWVTKLDPRDRDYEHNLLEALWTYQTLDVVEPKLLAQVLGAQDHHVRAAGTRVLAYWHGKLGNALELLAAAANDDHPQVRLEAVRALDQVHQPRAVEVAMQALDRPVDKYIDYALWLTARDLQPFWLSALEKGQIDFGGNPGHLAFALQALGTQDAVRPLVNLLKNGQIPPNRQESVLLMIAALGGPAELTMILDRVLAKEAPPPAAQVSLIGALEQAARQRKVRPAGDLNRAALLLNSDGELVRSAAARLAGAWQLAESRPQLLKLAQAESTVAAVRQAAIEGLALYADKESRDVLEKLAGADSPLGTRRQAVMALTGLDLSAAARLAVDVLAKDSKGLESAELFNAFLEQKNGANALATALNDAKLPTDVAKVGVRSVRATGRDAPTLVEALTKAGALTKGPRQLSDKEMKELITLITKSGDPARGEAVFRRTDMLCLRCHAIAGAGGQVGPDLSSIGGSAQVDYLIESILLPNKIVKEGFHSLSINTKSGRVVTGIKVRENKDELVLRNAEDKEVIVRINDIEDRTDSGSLMPDGLTDTLTDVEFVDLVRFLSELGKVGPYSVSKARLVRRWQVLGNSEESRQLLVRGGPGAAAEDSPALTWSSAYSQVSGTLPLDSLPKLDLRQPLEKAVRPTSFVRFQIDVSTAGKVKLLLKSATGLTLWVDRTQTEVKDDLTLDLPAGLHTLTLAINLSERKEGVSCELDEVPGSPARARIIGGK
jgi:putative heme-binding domain-containing protein